MEILGLLSIVVIFAFWIYFFIYSHQHKERSISPWGYSIVIIGIIVLNFGIPIFYEQVVIFSINLSLAIGLIGVFLNISNIIDLFSFRNKGGIFCFVGIGLLSGLLLGLHFITPEGIKYVQVSPKYTPIALIASTIQISIAEEILFRGYFLSYLRKCELNQIFAIVFQALIFTFLHIPKFLGDWTAVFINFLFEITAGYVTWKSNSLYPAIILHMSTNLMAVIWWLNAGQVLP